MAAPQRPMPVTVIAVLNFIFGGLGVLYTLCGGLAFLGMILMFQNLPAPPGGGPNPGKEFGNLFTSIPGFVPFTIGRTILDSVLAIVLIVAGFGLLRMRNWGRIASMVYAVITILTTVGATAYSLAIVNPAMEKGMAEFQAKMQKMQAQARPGAPAPPPPAFGGGGVTNVISTVVGAVFGVAYSIAILAVLNLPDVRKAFARAAAGTTDEDDRTREIDYLDEGPRFGRPRSEDTGFQRPDEHYQS
jgi:hypothetical protein